jgi:hypothetical protein
MKTALVILAVIWGGSLVAIVLGIGFIWIFGRESPLPPQVTAGPEAPPAPLAVPISPVPAPPPSGPIAARRPAPPEDLVVFRRRPRKERSTRS